MTYRIDNLLMKPISVIYGSLNDFPIDNLVRKAIRLIIKNNSSIYIASYSSEIALRRLTFKTRFKHIQSSYRSNTFRK